MNQTRRAFLTASSAICVGIPGCVEGELVDTTYNCDVDEPKSIPTPSRPTLGPDDAPISVTIFHDYTDTPSAIFVQDVVPDLLETYLDEEKIQVEFYNLPVPGDEDWAIQLASVGRYLYAEHGSDAYRHYLLSIYDHQGNYSWQAVGDIATTVGADACTTIAHGSWQTYEDEISDDRSFALSNEIDLVPSVFVDNTQIEEMSPVSESYNAIAEAINTSLDDSAQS